MSLVQCRALPGGGRKEQYEVSKICNVRPDKGDDFPLYICPFRIVSPSCEGRLVADFLCDLSTSPDILEGVPVRFLLAPEFCIVLLFHTQYRELRLLCISTYYRAPLKLPPTPMHLNLLQSSFEAASDSYASQPTTELL